MKKLTQKELIKHYEEVMGEKFDPELRILDARGTQLKELPVMPKLEFLDASGTQLKELPVMPKLRTLDARGTQLKELPVMPKLEYLDARGTQLKELPVMPKLEFLYARGTQLKELPVMPKLRTLYARGTQLKDKNAKIETLICSLPIGSRWDVTEFWKEANEIKCGCFNGTLEEFEKRVKSVYKTGKHRKDYLNFIKLCKSK